MASESLASELGDMADLNASTNRMSLGIAKGLSAEQVSAKQSQRLPQPRRASEVSKPKASQEEIEQKMKILMNTPKLWQEFKQYLAESGNRSASGTQKALREFIENNEEISALYAEQLEQAKREGGGRRRSRIMGAVNSLTSDFVSELGAEEASTSSRSGTSNNSEARRTSLSDASSAAASAGLRLLRRAGEVASSSISGLGGEAEAAAEASSSLNSSSADFMGSVNEWIANIAEEIEEQSDEDDERPDEKSEKRP